MRNFAYRTIEQSFVRRGFVSAKEADELMTKVPYENKKIWLAYLQWYDRDGSKGELLEILAKAGIAV